MKMKLGGYSCINHTYARSTFLFIEEEIEMNINEFMNGYQNHPVLFVGTGVSLRYLTNSFTWDALLLKISTELTGNDEQYYDLKSQCIVNDVCKYELVASRLEQIFNQNLIENRDGKFKEINDHFFEEMRQGRTLSIFKIYISNILSEIKFRADIEEELSTLKKARKNIGSVVTTNYDKLVQDIFEFNPLIGNDILLSNPYGSVYKIHGCVTDPSKIIITEDDYSKFKEKYDLIRAQLLSLFIHNPIIFLGYNVGDENIKDILKTIFTYVEPNSDAAEKSGETSYWWSMMPDLTIRSLPNMILIFKDLQPLELIK